MKILFDIVHPADVLFFYHPMRQLLARGDEIVVVSRVKDVTCELLDELGVEHRVASRAGSGVVGLGLELLGRDLALFKIVREVKPDIMIGFGGVSISHVGKLLGVPAISFYDTEVASLQTRITWPFITQLYVPNCYTGSVPKGRTRYFAGYKELSYLHPKHFKVDEDRAIAAGYDATRPNYFLRFVSWGANHDIGKTGWTADMVKGVVSELSKKGKVHISSEKALPPELEPYLYKGRFSDVHHLMALSAAYLGESATMAAEAAVLGVPAVFAADDYRGYIEEMVENGQVAHCAEVDAMAVLADLEAIEKDYKKLVPPIDLVGYIIEAIDEWGNK